MKKVIPLIIIIFFTTGFFNKEQKDNYLSYHKRFAEIEELIINENFIEAELKLHRLFKEYEVKFVKDYVIAAQICVLNKNTNEALDFLMLAIKNGVKIECLKSIELFNQRLTTANWNSIEKVNKELRKEYLKTIDLALYQEFHKRYQEEQDARSKEHYKEIVYANFNRIKEIIDTQEFIGEEKIGIDNYRFANSIADCDFGNSRIIVTLLHYDYPISEIGEDRLIRAIENGNLHPREFAAIYIYEKRRHSVLYKKSKKEYPELPVYNFNFPFGDIVIDLSKVNADREKFGICKYEVEKKRAEICRKYGMRLAFNYR